VLELLDPLAAIGKQLIDPLEDERATRTSPSTASTAVKGGPVAVSGMWSERKPAQTSERQGQTL
jgi:hypothetical protein